MATHDWVAWAQQTGICSIGVILLAVLITVVKKHVVLHYIADLPPGSLGLPIIGETLDFILTAPTGQFYTLREKLYGPVFKTHLFGNPTIYISGPECMRDFFQNESRCLESCWPPSLSKLLGRGCLATSSGFLHRTHKRVIFQALYKMDSSQRSQTFENIIKKEIKKWAEADQIEVYESVRLLNIQCIFLTLFGVTATTEEITKIADLIQKYGAGFFTLPFWFPGSTFSKAFQAKSMLRGMLQEKMSHFGKDSLVDDIVTNLSKGSNALEQPMDVILDAVLELLYAGQETLTGFLTCAIHLLSDHPLVLTKLRHSLKYGPFAIHSDDVVDYTDCVAKEVLRFYPPVGGGFRKAVHTFTIKGYTIPRDWSITYSIKSTHNQSEFFQDLTVFNPDRWLLASVPNFHYLPFSAGHHGCIGKHYARNLGRQLLKVVAECLEWEPQTEKVQMKAVPVVKPSRGLYIKARWRAA